MVAPSDRDVLLEGNRNMFFKRAEAWPLEGARTVERKCSNCHNMSQHVVYVVPTGPSLGLIFLKKPLLGRRNYFLTCPVCGTTNQELSKEQAMAMKDGPS